MQRKYMYQFCICISNNRISRNLKSDQQEALENFQNRLIKAERSINADDVGYVSQKEDPSAQYEMLRRRLSNNIQEFWYFISSEVIKLQKQVNDLAPDLMASLNNLLNLGAQQKRYKSLVKRILRIITIIS